VATGGRVAAQTPPPLQEVVVSASLEQEIPQQLAQYGTRVDTVSADQIKTGGYLDVAQSLEASVPGLYIASRNGPFDYVNISLQGSRTADVLWLVDGVRINNRLYAGTTPLDTIPASMIERIEVLDGGQALYYGTQAVAGAINIVTKAFVDHPDGAFSLGVDSSNGRHIDGYFGDAIERNHFVVYGSHDESSGFQPFPSADYQPSGTDRHRAYDVTTLGGKYGYNFTDHLAFSALYQHTDARLDFANPFLQAEAFNARNEDLVSSRLDYIPSEQFKLYLKDYYHRWSSYYTEYDNGSTAFSFTPGAPGQITLAEKDDFWGYKDYGVNLVSEIAVNRGLEYVAGYDFQNYTGRDAVLVIQQQTERVNAFFTQIRSTPELIPNTHLAVGLRYSIPSVGQSALVWNVGGQYDLSRTLFLRANAGTAFRLATAEELFANDPEDERGDPQLKPETSTNLNASIGGTLLPGSSQLHWEAISFYRSIRNLIDFQSFDAVTDQDVFGNDPSKVMVHGEEITLDGTLSAVLSAHLSGTYSHSRQTGSNVQFDQIPVTLFKAGLDYHPSSRYGASINLVHLGEIEAEPLGAGNGRYAYGNYSVVDLGARLYLDPARHHRIDLHLNNVLNHVYFTGLGFGASDSNGAPYVVHDLALPRIFAVNYTYSLQ
jgi:vitamin B12 transporter